MTARRVGMFCTRDISNAVNGSSIRNTNPLGLGGTSTAAPVSALTTLSLRLPSWFSAAVAAATPP